MNTSELQQLKMAWLAAREAGDIQAQTRLLQDHPGELEALTDFIAAYHATGGDVRVELDASLLPLTQRAYQSALDRVFAPEPQLAFARLSELRKSRGLGKVDVARGLRLSVDVWNKFETGAIEFASLQRRQLERLAQFFQVSSEQFSTLLNNSQPAVTLNWRKTHAAARQQKQGPQAQSFAEAITRSTMSKEDKQFWLEL